MLYTISPLRHPLFLNVRLYYNKVKLAQLLHITQISHIRTALKLNLILFILFLNLLTPLPTCAGTPVNFILSGRVFEDINYGGGAGRNYAIANTIAMASGWADGDILIDGALVELYDSSGSFVSNTTTSVTGTYSFTINNAGNYFIRVVNYSLNSNRGRNNRGKPIIPVQTYRSNGTSDFINEIGGLSPNKVDAPANTTNSNISTLTTVITAAQSVSEVSVASAVSGSLNDIDFGFSYDVIVNINNADQGSLRQFIINSNELNNTNLDQSNDVTVIEPLMETSIFMIPGTGPHIINPTTTFDLIRDDYTHVNGYMQAGSVQGDIPNRIINIELIGNTALFDGLSFFASYVQVSGMAIHRFRKGIYSNRNGGVENFFWGNYIGTGVSGLTDGFSPSNVSYGIHMYNLSDSYMGTNADGFNDANEGNLLSSSYFGGYIQNCSNLLHAGNFVGTDKTGTNSLSNRYNGTVINRATGINIIGIDDRLSNPNPDHMRNVISGNIVDGIRIIDSDHQVIAGNFLGPDITGLSGLTNGNYGVQISGASSYNIIGTDSDGNHDLLERNIISFNGTGVRTLVNGTGRANIIAGNYIGTDVTGNVALGNLNNGIDINSYPSTRIGTNGDGVRDEIEKNIISGNEEDGIRISSADSTQVSGNCIGLGADGVTPLGNGKRGVLITVNSMDAIIGYDPSMIVSDPDIIGNKIHHNTDAAVAVTSGATRNRISRNSMYDNGAIGIDLNYDSVTANDNGDSDSGANNLLNFPVFDLVTWSEDSILTVTGYAPLGSAIELFLSDNGQNPNPLPTGYTASFGEGDVFFFEGIEGSVDDLDATTGTYNNDGTGTIFNRTQNRFEFVIDTKGLAIEVGTIITATSRDVNDNTSEFSNVIEVQSDCCTTIMTNGYLRNIPRQ